MFAFKKMLISPAFHRTADSMRVRAYNGAAKYCETKARLTFVSLEMTFLSHGALLCRPGGMQFLLDVKAVLTFAHAFFADSYARTLRVHNCRNGNTFSDGVAMKEEINEQAENPVSFEI